MTRLFADGFCPPPPGELELFHSEIISSWNFFDQILSSTKQILSDLTNTLPHSHAMDSMFGVWFILRNTHTQTEENLDYKITGSVF